MFARTNRTKEKSEDTELKVYTLAFFSTFASKVTIKFWSFLILFPEEKSLAQKKGKKQHTQRHF